MLCDIVLLLDGTEMRVLQHTRKREICAAWMTRFDGRDVDDRAIGDNRIADMRSIRVESSRVGDRPFKHYYPLLPVPHVATKASMFSIPWKRNPSMYRHSRQFWPTSSPFLSMLVRDATCIARLLFRTMRAGLSSSSLGLSNDISHRPACSTLVLFAVDAALKCTTLLCRLLESDLLYFLILVSIDSQGLSYL